MSLEAIKTISGAEDTARNIKAEAGLNAKKAIADTEAAGAAAIKAATTKAEEELRELAAQAEEKARKQAEELVQTTENTKAAMRTNAEAKLEQAASLVVERIVNS